MPHPHPTALSNQALSTQRAAAAQAATGNVAPLPTPAALAPPAPPVIAQAPPPSGLANNIKSLVAASQGGIPAATPVAGALAPPALGGGIANSLSATVLRANDVQSAPAVRAAPPPFAALSRGTPFGRQFSDQNNPQSLL